MLMSSRATLASECKIDRSFRRISNMTGQSNGDSAQLQRAAFPRMYRMLDEGRITSSVRELLASFMGSMDLSWMQEAKSISGLCTHTITIPDTGDSQPVHGLLLARKSMFFDALIKYTDDSHLQLPYEFEGFAFLKQSIATVLDSIASDERVSVLADNCIQLYQAADYLLYDDLKTKVLDWIKVSGVDNLGLVLDMWAYSEVNYLPEINKLAFDQILHSFASVIVEPVWLQLDYRQVHKILSHSGINCSSELLVLDAASRWLLASWPERQGHGEGLLACVRRGLLSTTDTAALVQHEIMARYPMLLALFLGYPFVLTDAVELYNDHSAALAASTTPREPHEAVMLFGGWCQEDGPRAACQVFNPRANTWTMWTPNAARPANCIGQVERRVYAGCVLVNDVLHLVGGYDGEKALGIVSCYNLRSPGAGWYEGSCMNSKRYYVCCTVLDSQIYAIGGHSGDTQDRHGGRLDSVERMHVGDNTWLPVASMRTVRSDAGAAVLDGRVYVAGGFNGQQYHDTVEAYSPATDQWTFVTRMNFLRGGVSLVTMGNSLYAIGGNDGQTRLAVVETYQNEYDGWVFAGRLSRQKSNLSTTVLEGGIMVMGGWSDQPTVGILSSVEKFMPSAAADSATQHAADMAYAASATAACTVLGRELVARYLSVPSYPNPWLIGEPPSQQQQQQQQQQQMPQLLAPVLATFATDPEASTDIHFISSHDTDGV